MCALNRIQLHHCNQQTVSIYYMVQFVEVDRNCSHKRLHRCFLYRINCYGICSCGLIIHIDVLHVLYVTSGKIFE